VLKISVTTLLKRIISIEKNIQQPPIVKGKTYEVDEMRTFIGKKSILRWIVHALDNLLVRTHLKRLNRKTICFSRSLTVLMAVLRIYFWG
jgi:IS1 family transposase